MLNELNNQQKIEYIIVQVGCIERKNVHGCIKPWS